MIVVTGKMKEVEPIAWLLHRMMLICATCTLSYALDPWCSLLIPRLIRNTVHYFYLYHLSQTPVFQSNDGINSWRISIRHVSSFV